MSVREPHFQHQVALTALQYKFYATVAHPAPPAAVNAELQAISTALASDTSSHDHTIEAPPAALRIGADKTRFTNDILILVNKGKGGNLAHASMIAAIDGVAGVLAPPGVIDTPFVSGNATHGSVLSCTTGNWVGTPTGYAYQWKRGGATNVGTNANTYTTVAGDVGYGVGCIVTATNATGSTAAPPSNQITVT
jgi:hypothetical protein